MEKDTFKIRYSRIIVFFFTFGSIGLPLGLLSLTIGPTRKISEFCREQQWSFETENWIQKTFIFFFCFLILLASLRLMHLFFNRFPNLYKGIYIAFFSICLLSSLYVFSFKPQLLIIPSKGISFKNQKTEFYFGSYPDEAKLYQLKKENYTAVISLLNEAVVPAEPILMKEEVTNTQKIGLKLISIPMLPWIVNNDASIKKIKELAKSAKGKYYVHCYLGKDRASVFRNIIENENKNIVVKSNSKRKDIENKKLMERGAVVKISKDIYITPFPTDEEIIKYFIGGRIKTVISLMDPKDKLEQPRIASETDLMTQYNQPFYNIPVMETDSDIQIKKIIKQINSYPKPIIIHDYLSESPFMKKFITLYQQSE